MARPEARMPRANGPPTVEEVDTASRSSTTPGLHCAPYPASPMREEPWVRSALVVVLEPGDVHQSGAGIAGSVP